MFIQSNMFIYVYVFVKRAEEKKNTIGSKKKKNEGKYMITKQS